MTAIFEWKKAQQMAERREGDQSQHCKNKKLEITATVREIDECNREH